MTTRTKNPPSPSPLLALMASRWRRETVAFAMDHPALARRVLPLILPYLDRAA